MTINELKEKGILDLMPNGFNVYNYEDESPICTMEFISENWKTIKETWQVRVISGDPEELIAAIYVSKP